MTRRTCCHPGHVTLLVGLAFVFATAPAHAQNEKGGAAGAVLDAATGLPLRGAHISIAGKRRATTAKDGSFRIDELPTGDILMRIERDGYTGVVENVLIHGGWVTAVEFELTPMVVMLDALTVQAGLGARAPRGEDPASVVRGDRIGAGGSAESLAGQLPGVHVIRPGAIGSGGRIMIRGPSSITGSNEPIFYVDGVRVEGRTPTMTPSTGGYWVLDFIDPGSIDRIEVLRGPATATRYGLEAANGVVLIYTRRGGD
jgi:TonB-dependent SusC/RagA subfamily outer membrane receptor